MTSIQMNRPEGVGIAARAFLVGSPRSGTTLLQSLLCAHSELHSIPETHFYSRLPSRNRVLRKLGFARHDAPNEFADLLKKAGLPVRWVRGWSTGFYMKYFVGLLDEATFDLGKSVWLEKTPRHLHHIEDIARAVPEVKFIHMTREASDVVASLYEVTHQHPEVWGGPRSLDACINRWLKDKAISDRYADQPNHFIATYEDLVDDPEWLLRELFAFLNLVFEDNVLTNYADASEGVVDSREAWKSNVREGITDTRNKKFRQVLNFAQQEHVLNRIRSRS